MKVLWLLLLVACSQPVPTVVADTAYGINDTINPKQMPNPYEYDTGRVIVSTSSLPAWEEMGHDCTRHQVLIMGDSSELVMIGAPGDMHPATSTAEVVNFMIDSMSYHLIRNCKDFSGLQ